MCLQFYLSIYCISVFVWSRWDYFFTGEAGAEVDMGQIGALFGGRPGGGRGPAGNWVLTERLPHGPTPTGRVLHPRGVAATIAASHL